MTRASKVCWEGPQDGPVRPVPVGLWVIGVAGPWSPAVVSVGAALGLLLVGHR
jgi:hypothetical protein